MQKEVKKVTRIGHILLEIPSATTLIFPNLKSGKWEEKVLTPGTVLGLDSGPGIGKGIYRYKLSRLRNAHQILRVLLVLLLAWVSVMGIGEAAPASVGHYASAISSAEFESGNYSFPDSLFVKEYFNVSDKFWVSIDGKVGIGITSTTGLLNINGSSEWIYPFLNITNGTDDLMTFHGANATFDPNDDTLFVDFDSNRVGIGTTAPSKKFEVIGTAAVGALNATSMTVADLAHFMANVRMNDNLTVGNALYVDSSIGRVGIGTATPAQRLDVRGAGNFSGTIYFNNDTDVSTFVSSTGLNETYMRTWDNTTIWDNLTDISTVFGTIHATHSDDNSTIWTNLTDISTVFGTIHATHSDDNSTTWVNISSLAGLINDNKDTHTQDNTTLTDMIDGKTPQWGWTNTTGGVIYNTQLTDKVGIGTTSPSAKLDIVGPAYATPIATFRNNDSDAIVEIMADTVMGLNLGISNPSGDRIAYIGSEAHLSGGGSVDDFAIRATHSLSFIGGGSGIDMVINDSGNVGIGTENPGRKIELAGTALDPDDGMFRSSYAGSNHYWDFGRNNGDGQGQFEIRSRSGNGESTHLAITTGGKVGIGTTSPASILHIDGVNPLFTMTDTVDDYPTFQIYQTAHDDVALIWDAYIDGAAWKSSDAGSNFWIYKYSDGLNFMAESGIAQGSATTYSTAMTIQADADVVFPTGNVGIGTTGPTTTLNVKGTLNVTDLALFESNVSFADNLTVGGNTLYVDSSSGRVGIGTTSPANLLDIYRAATNVIARVKTDSDTSYATMQVNADEDALLKIVAYADSYSAGNVFGRSKLGNTYIINEGGELGIGNYHAEDLYFATNQIERMAISSTGNVGIGTTSPSGLLHINGTAATLLNITNGTGVDDKSFLTVESTGNVTVGTSGGRYEDLLVYGVSYAKATGTLSPMVIKSIDNEPIPICMKADNDNWVGCRPKFLNGNYEWVCEPNRECDKKVLEIGTTEELANEGASDEEIDEKVAGLKQKFKDGKDLKTIKDEIRSEIGELDVLDELSDDTPISFSISPVGENVSDAVVAEVVSLKSENDMLKQRLAAIEQLLNISVNESEQPAEAPANETVPAEQPVEQPEDGNETLPEEETPQEEPAVEEPSSSNNAPTIDSFAPENTAPLYIGESQEFTISASDADGDELSMQWFVNSLAIADETSAAFTFAAEEAGEFEIKALVTDNFDYSTNKWVVSVVNETGTDFSITGSATGVAEPEGGGLWAWLASLFS